MAATLVVVVVFMAATLVIVVFMAAVLATVEFVVAKLHGGIKEAARKKIKLI